MKTKRHAIIVAHPNADSFTLSVARRYQTAVEALGAKTILRDLYRLNFEPCLDDGEIPRSTGFAAASDVAEERNLIGDCDVFAFIYPLWFNAPPAILLGYIQRVFGMGFGFGPIQQGGNTHLLAGRHMISFSSSGAPSEWLRTEGAWNALRNLFDNHLADVCGLSVLDHRHFGEVSENLRPDWIARYLDEVAATVEQYFKP